MRFEFLNEEANDILEICKRAEKKKDDYIKTLGRTVSKKEEEALSEKFIREEYLKYLENVKNKIEQEKTSKKNIMDYPDINEDYDYDSLEFDEIQDLLDED